MMISGGHVSLATTLWLQTAVSLGAGDTVELQGYFQVDDDYFSADPTSVWAQRWVDRSGTRSRCAKPRWRGQYPQAEARATSSLMAAPQRWRRHEEQEP